MTETIEAKLATHDAQIGAVQTGLAKVESNIFLLVLFMMGTFASSAGALLSILLTHK